MAKLISKKHQHWFKRLEHLLIGSGQVEHLDQLHHSLLLPTDRIALPTESFPLRLELGNTDRVFHIYAEDPLSPAHATPENQSYILFDPEHYFKDISGFYRLQPGDELILGKEDTYLHCLGKAPETSSHSLLSIHNEAGHLSFSRLSEKQGSCLSPLLRKKDLRHIRTLRLAKLKRLTTLFGGPLRPLDPRAALRLIRTLNKHPALSLWRPKDRKHRPGSLVEIPDHITPIIIGDLHTKLDNLLALLSQNAFLKALKRGTACLIFLGDAVHSEEPGQLEQMASSMLMMDFIFSLMLHFPGRVIYLLGNHDGFHESISKQGISQGLLWEQALLKERGKAYLKEMRTFYHHQPFIATGRDFITCHAAPPMSRIGRKELINLRDHPKLIREIITNRIHRPNRPGGYNKKDVKLFRKMLGLETDAEVIVGHTPLSNNETIWSLDGFKHHHVIYGADHHWVPVMTRIHGKLIPLIYPCEPLIELANGL
jgi:hypothetical protein